MTTGYLEHFGIRGMHWGHRKSKIWSSQNKPRATGKETKQEKKKMSTKKKVAIGAAIVGGTLLAAYGGYKVTKIIKQKDAQKITETGKSLLSKFNQSKEFKDADENIKLIKDLSSNSNKYSGIVEASEEAKKRIYSLKSNGEDETNKWIKDTLTNRKFKDSFSNVVLKKDKGTTQKLISSLSDLEKQVSVQNKSLFKAADVIDRQRFSSGFQSWQNTVSSGASALKKSSVVDDYTQELLRRGRV